MSAPDTETTRYLTFIHHAANDFGRKTQVWSVRATRDYAILGTIKWFGRWRQYAFYPQPDMVFNPECLRDIADKAEALTKAHRRIVLEIKS